MGPERKTTREEDAAAPKPVERAPSILLYLKAWAGSLRAAALRKPVAAASLLGIAAILGLLAGTALVGLWTHRAREALLHFPPGQELDYSLWVLLHTGATVLWTLPWKALRSLASGPPAITASAWVLVLAANGWLWLARIRRPAVLLTALALSLATLIWGAAFFRFAVRAFAPEQRGEDVVFPVPSPGPTLTERTIFESVTWLRNPSPAHNAHREALNGLFLWLVIATVAGAPEFDGAISASAVPDYAGCWCAVTSSSSLFCQESCPRPMPTVNGGCAIRGSPA